MATYYVDSVNGSDGAAGTSTGTAWQTISRVQTLIDGAGLAAGDFVLFKCGGWYVGNLIVKQSGAAGNVITFGQYGTGLKPVLDANNTTSAPTWSIGDWSAATHHWTVDGLAFTNAVYYSISLDNGVHDIEIKNCEFFNTGVGINCGTNSYNISIHNNLFRDGRMVQNINDPSDYGAIGVNIGSDSGGTTHDITCNYNRFIRMRTDSLAFGHDGAAFEFHAPGTAILNNITCNYNYVEGADCFMEAGGNGNASSQFTNSVFAYNVVYNGWGGIAQLHNLPGDTSLAIGTYSLSFDNNFYMANASSTDVAVWFGGTNGISTPNFRNNIFVMNSGVKVCAISGGGNPTTYFSHSYNIFYGDTITITLGTGDANTNPLMTNVWCLQSGSPARGAGTNRSYSTDFNGIAVPATPDKGAAQYILLGYAPTWGAASAGGGQAIPFSFPGSFP